MPGADQLAPDNTEPKTKGKLEIGTASWTSKSLVDSCLDYPEPCESAQGRLRFHAAEFPIVEVDSSYYALPDHLTFNIKAFRL